MTPAPAHTMLPTAPSVSFEAALAAADALAIRARRESTRRVYHRLWTEFEGWALARDARPLPASGPVVAAWLATLLVKVRDDGTVERDAAGVPLRGRLAPASVALALSAVDAKHSDSRVRRPGRRPEVRAVLAAAWDLFGHGGHRTDAITADDLSKVLVAGDPHDAGNRLAFLFGAPGLLTGQALADLTLHDVWEAVAWASTSADPHERYWAERVAEAASVLVGCEHDPDRPALGTGRAGANRMSRHGATKRTARIAAAAGLALTGDRPTLAQTAAAEERLMPVDLALTRDRALLSLGFTCALRPSELAWFRWCDIDWHDDPDQTLTGRLAKSKSSAPGSGKYLAVQTGQAGTGPGHLLRQWRQEATRVLGVDPVEACPRGHVFFRLDRAGAASARVGSPLPLSPDAVGEIVTRRCEGAHLDGHWAGGSLRSGVVSELARADATVAQIKAVTGQRSTDVLLRYVRADPATGWGVTDRLGL